MKSNGALVTTDIDEAINHSRDIAKACEKNSGCQVEHYQLAEWLEELKEYRLTGFLPEEIKEMAER